MEEGQIAEGGEKKQNKNILNKFSQLNGKLTLIIYLTKYNNGLRMIPMYAVVTKRNAKVIRGIKLPPGGVEKLTKGISSKD